MVASAYPMRVLFASTAIASLLAWSATEAMAQTPTEATVDDVIVVTGTRIKGLSRDEVASPVQVITREEIDRLAPGGGQPSDFLRNVPQADAVFRSNLTGSSRQVEGNFGGGSVNLRGLGSGATLTLLNGRRQAAFPAAQDGRVDVNSLTPPISIDRVDILLDGGSALYGTDAVAGVVNFVTRDKFSGMELRADLRGSTDDWNTSDWTLGLLAGGQLTDRLHLVVAAGAYNQEGLSRGERGVIRGIAQAFSSTGFPGNFNVPTRNASGGLTGSSATRADPDCGRIADSGVTQNQDGLGTDTFFSGSRCLYAIKGQLLVIDQRRYTTRAALTFDASELLQLKASAGYSYVTATQEFTQTSSILRPVVVPGFNPGNTFRAVDGSGRPLFAAPDSANPSRPLRNAAGQVVLTANPTDPASGIAFNEDVTLSFRPLSTTNAPLRGYDNVTRSSRFDLEASGRLNSRLDYSLALTFSDNRATESLSDVNLPAFVAALNGRGGVRTSQFYNPFGNALFAAPGSAQYNDPAVAAGFVVTTRDTYYSSLATFDASIQGELFQLPAGAAKFAAGAQLRRDRVRFSYDPLRVAGLLGFNAIPGRNFGGVISAQAGFAELAAPLWAGDLGKLELSAAARYESIEGESRLNPKIGLIFSNRYLKLRGSYSQSFATPSLFQRFAAVGSSQFVADPATGQQNVQVFGYTSGSDTLMPQTSNNYSAGFELRPIGGLTFGADYFAIDFKDLLAAPTAQAVVNGGGPNVIRDASGRITEVRTPYFNASSIKARGIDIHARYEFPTSRVGQFSLSEAATWMQKYAVQLVAGGPVFDGVGDANNNNIGDPIPEWRSVTQLGWTMGPHAANISARYTSQVRMTSGSAVDYARAMLQTDIAYSYDHRPSGLQVSVGVINLFNKLANPVTTAAAAVFIPNVQDPFPRRVYITLEKRF